MRILILTQFYPPETQTKVLSDLAVGLQSLGNEVTVLTGFPNYPSGQLYSGYRIRCWQRETLGGVKILRVPLYPDHSGSGFQRALNYLSFSAAAMLLGPLLLTKHSVILAYSTPYTAGLSAWFLSKVWGTPFVFNVADLWPETLAATGMVRNRCLLAAVGSLAKWIYARAAMIILISKGLQRNLINKGVANQKLRIVPCWVDTGFYRPLPPNTYLSERLGFKGYFCILYAGAMGRAQNLLSVLRAAEAVTDPKIKFLFAGSGLERPVLESYVATRHLKNVSFIGQFPEAEMPSILALADVLIVHLKDELLFRITVPHKIHAYLAAGKPILCAVAGDAADVVSASGAGLTCSPDNPASIAESVMRLAGMSPGQLAEMGRKGRRSAEAEFSVSALIKRVDWVLREATGKGRHEVEVTTFSST